MKLSFVSHEFPPIGGGAATALDALTRALVRRGHQVQVVTTGLADGAPNASTEDDRTITRVGVRRTSLAPTAPELLRSALALCRRGPAAVAAFGPDLVVGFFAWPGGAAAARSARQLDVPLCISVRGSDVPGFGHPSLRGALARRLSPWPLRSANVVVANGERLASLVRDHKVQTPVVSIPNGVEADRLCESHGSTGDALEVGFVGQLIPRKRVGLALLAFAAAVRSQCQLRLTVIGDGPLKHRLERQHRDLISQGLLSFAGSQTREQVAEHLSRFDALLHLSAAEGVSNVLLEGLASGLAVIASPEVVADLGDEVRAAVLPVTPSEGAVARALCMLARDERERLTLQRRAREAAEHFSWEHAAEAWEEVFESLAANPPVG